jgi:hypothetical protein
MRGVGVQPLYLNKCIERKSYGIEPSIRAGKGRGSRRLFSEDDVFGVALIWWLFESGLRLRTIEYILNRICGRRLNSKASDAARIVLERETEMLEIRRWPRTFSASARGYPRQEVTFIDRSRASQFTEEADMASLLVIPVGKLFTNLKESMEKLGQ